jgi:hypothetical protein
LLEASRESSDVDGRRYTIHIAASDGAGNTATRSLTVTVPPFVANSLQGRILGEVSLVEGAISYWVGTNVKKHSSVGVRAEFAVKRVAPNRTDRFFSDTATGVSFMLGSGSLIDSVIYTGTGRWNGHSGYRFEAYVIDRGDPGPGMDEIRFKVFDPSGAIAAQFSGLVAQGNIRSTTY